MKTIQREELYRALWRAPMGTLAGEWQVDVEEIRKAAEALLVPRPKSGHWTRAGFGKVSSEPLPEMEEGRPTSFSFGEKTSNPTLPESVLQELSRFEMARKGVGEARHFCPPVLATKKAFAASAPHAKGAIIYPNFKMPHVTCVISKATLDRSLRLLDCVLRCATHLGAEFPVVNDRFKMKVGDDSFDFLIKERRMRVAIERAEQEWYLNRFDYVPTGELQFQYETAWEAGAQYSWKDGKTRTLEDVVPEIVRNILKVAQAHRTRRLKFEAQRREFERQAIERKEKEAKAAREKRCLDQLLEGAAEWQQVEDLKQFLAEANKRMEGCETEEFLAWKAWGEAVARKLDPFTAKDLPWVVHTRMMSAEHSTY